MSEVLMTRCAPVLSLRSLVMALALTASALAPLTAHAGPERDLSNGSAGSLVLSAVSGVGVSATVPEVLAVSAGMTMVVVAAQSAAGVVTWVLESAVDGSRIVLRVSERAVKGASVVAGTALLVTATSAGWVLSAAGQALCFVPNQIGASLTYNERITR